MSNKKVAFFATSMEGGGAERVSLNLAKTCAERGYSVDLLLNSVAGPYMQFVPDNVRIIDLNKPGLLKSTALLARYIQQEKPLAIHCSVTDRGLSASMAKMLLFSNVKVVIEVENTVSKQIPNPTTKQKIYQELKNLLFPRSAKLVAVSQGVAEDLMKNFRIPIKSIEVIYNPVVTKQLKSEMQGEAGHKWLLEKSAPVVLAAGRLAPQKDFATLITAFKYVVSKCDARLIIVGEGEQRNMLTSLVQELDLTDYVDMPGFVDNPYAYMKHSDLFVLSSIFEGFGNVIAEAMACGCPIVSTDCPSGPSEILQNGEYGTLVPVGDAESLGQAIIDALQQDHDINKLLERAEDFSEDKIVDEYLKLFQ